MPEPRLQNVRREFVTGVLSEEELGNKIFVHELPAGEYAERVASLRAYDAVSRDVVGRWAFPFAPDTNVLPAPPPASAPWATGSTYAYSRGNVYMCGRAAMSLSPSPCGFESLKCARRRGAMLLRLRIAGGREHRCVAARGPGGGGVGGHNLASTLSKGRVAETSMGPGPCC